MKIPRKLSKNAQHIDKPLGSSGKYQGIDLKVSAALLPHVRKAIDFLRTKVPDKFQRYFKGQDPTQVTIHTIVEGTAPAGVAGWHKEEGIIHLNMNAIKEFIDNEDMDEVEAIATILLHEAAHEEFPEEAGPEREERELANRLGKPKPII